MSQAKQRLSDIEKKSVRQTIKVIVVSAIALCLIAVVLLYLILFVKPDPNQGLIPEIAPQQSTREYSNIKGEISRFFANFSRWRPKKPPEPAIVDFPLPEQALATVLSELPNQRTLSRHWVGPKSTIWFMPGDTLQSSLQRAAKDANIHLIWWLDKDFNVTSPFSLTPNIAAASIQVASSIKSQYQGGVGAYLCPTAATIIITTHTEALLLGEQCHPIRTY